MKVDTLKYMEKQARWLRRHKGHRIEKVNVDGAIVLVCMDCDRALAARDEQNAKLS